MDHKSFIDRYMSGKKFKSKYDLKENKFIRLVTHDGNHNGLVIDKGLVEDKKVFFPYDQCQPGGIYFIRQEDVVKWIIYTDKCITHFMYVNDIPDDAEVYIENDKFKASQLILSEKHDLRKYLLETYGVDKIIELRKGVGIEAVKKYIDFYFSDQTEEKALELIKTDKIYYFYVIDKTPTIIIEACKKIISAVPVFNNQISNDVLLELIKHNYNLILYIPDPTKEILITAVDEFNKIIQSGPCTCEGSKIEFKSDQKALDFLKENSLVSLIERAFVLLNSDNNNEEKNLFLNGIHDQIEDFIEKFIVDKQQTNNIFTGLIIQIYLTIYAHILYKFIKKSWTMIENIVFFNNFSTKSAVVRFLEDKLVMAALDQSYEAVELVEQYRRNEREIMFDRQQHEFKSLTNKWFMYALSKSWEAIKFIIEPSEDMCMFAIMKNWNAVKFIDSKYLTQQMYDLAAEQSEEARMCIKGIQEYGSHVITFDL
jgi:hypothetical protein